MITFCDEIKEATGGNGDCTLRNLQKRDFWFSKHCLILRIWGVMSVNGAWGQRERILF